MVDFESSTLNLFNNLMNLFFFFFFGGGGGGGVLSELLTIIYQIIL